MPKGCHNNHPRGAEHYRWNTDRIFTTHGYVKVRVGVGHPLADPNGYAYEHLCVWVTAGNPRPARGQILHHLNEDKTDNRISNLRLLTRAEHNRIHNAKRTRDTGGRFAAERKAA